MYTKRENVEMLRGHNFTDEEALWFPTVEEAARLFIEDQVGDTFTESAISATTRYYNCEGTILNIDTCSEISAVNLVTNDESLSTEFTVNEDYEARPRNETYKTWIQFRTGKLPRGVANIAVTAKFGYAEIPKDIVYLATYLSNLMLSKLAAGDKVKESIEGYSVEFRKISMEDEIVKMVLNRYQKEDVLL